MAIIGNTYLNLIDTLKQTDGAAAGVAEVLHTLHPFMKDANVQTANKGTKHVSNIRAGLPSVSWGALYQGIVQSKGNYTQVEDSTGFVEGLSSVDKRLVDLYPNQTSQLRLMEGQGFMESMAQTIDSAIWYSNVGVNGKQFHGLSPRYNTLANPNVINGGGVGADNTSIWLVTHGDMQTSVIVPQNITAGIQREEKGEQRILDGSNNPYYVLEELYRQHIGLTVKDWRFNARIANIDVSDVQAGTRKLLPLMASAYYALQGRRNYKMEAEGEVSSGRTVIYMNRAMIAALDAEAAGGYGAPTANATIRLTPMTIQGEEVQSWRGIPIRETDAILNTETLVA